MVNIIKQYDKMRLWAYDKTRIIRGMEKIYDK